MHVRKGCLSGIAPSGGTSRNEGIHRVFNKTLKKSRIGVQFAIALLGMFFYMWNEKRISADTNDKQSKVRIIPPIESYFDKLENTTEITVESFGIQGHSVSSETDMDEDDENTSCLKERSVDSSVANIVTKVNSFLREDMPTSSSDEDEYCHSASVNSTLPLSDEFKRQVLNNSKSMEEFSKQIKSISKFEKFKPHMVMFGESSLKLLNSDMSKNKETSVIDGILANYNMSRLNTPRNGNCFFQSVAHALSKYIIPHKSVSSDMLSHLQKLGLINQPDIDEVCAKLRTLIVEEEWMRYPDAYTPFITGTGRKFEIEAKLFLNDGHFASELGKSMPLAIANLLKLPLVLITQMENFPVLPITPRESLQCLPIFVAYDQSGPGHYDAVVQIENMQPTEESLEASTKEIICMDVAVARAQERKLKILLPVINSTKDANAFKDFRAALIHVIVEVVKTLMEEMFMAKKK